jgi:hypothetical protein
MRSPVRASILPDRGRATASGDPVPEVKLLGSTRQRCSQVWAGSPDGKVERGERKQTVDEVSKVDQMMSELGGPFPWDQFGRCLRPPERHPACRRREARPDFRMERENPFSDAEGQATSGSNRERESTEGGAGTEPEAVLLASSEQPVRSTGRNARGANDANDP